MSRHTTIPVRARRWLFVQLAGLSVVASLALSDHAHAAEYLTAVAGGGGGNSFALRCAPDQVLAGVSGKASAFVDKLGPLCVQVDSLGRWLTNNDSPGATAGGTGGTDFWLRCPANHAVSGIQGRASALIDQLRIRCGPLTAGARLASSGTVLGSHGGGSGGNAFGPFDCVDNKPGRGLIGRAGIYVDQLQLACDYPPSPLTSVGAQMLDEATRTLTSIVRARGETFLRIIFSSAPASFSNTFVPVKSNNANVAVVPYDSFHPGEVEMQRFIPENYLGTFVQPKSVGCASFEVGFPGHVAPPVHVLVDSPHAVQLALSLSILEWTAKTTGVFGTLTIPAAAPSGGVSVTLISSEPTQAIIPPSVTIPAGSRNTTFEIRRPLIGSPGGCVIVTATGHGASVQSAMLFHSTGLPSRTR